MRAESPDWVVLGEPASSAERAALETFRELLPDDGTTRAWVNLTFVDHNGRTGEVDVLLLTPAGFFVVELKGWHGRIHGDDQRWTLVGTRTKVVDNPYLVTDRKAKRLSSLLKEHAPNPDAKRHMPFLGSLVVLHGEDSQVELTERAKISVVALDGYRVKGLELLSRRLATPPGLDERGVVDARAASNVKKACDRAGFRPTPRTRMIGQYPLADAEPLVEGDGWADYAVDHPVLRQRRRLRLFDLSPRATADERARVQQQAERELRLTQGLRHEGITAPVEIIGTDSGPALLFEDDTEDVRLLDHLGDNAERLTLEQRMALVRQLGEVLKYAHERRLVHRALAPEHVWVRPSTGRLAVRDWWTGQKERATSQARLTALSAGITDVRAAVPASGWLYLAPEALRSSADLPDIPLDVYGFGALAILVLSGRPPAATLAELQQILDDHESLDPGLRTGDLPDGVVAALELATAAEETDRPTSVAAVLSLLEEGWRAGTGADAETPREAPPDLDPVQAQAGDVVGDRFIVEGRRGEGSTGVALLVQDATRDERRHVLKLAVDERAERRLAAEADVLRTLDSPRVVRLLDGPVEVGSRRGLLLSDAGPMTLAARLATEGRATIGQLEQFGSDLLEAVRHLLGRGVFHRDIKPANLGIAQDPGTRKPRLTLFDLSLAGHAVDDITAGTLGYLDPYLGQGRRTRYDTAAELWAVAATLFEMATGEAPWWPTGGRSPGARNDAPVVTPSVFEASVSAPLTAFFTRALAPVAADRFGDVDELTKAWQDAFAAVDLDEGTAEANDAAAEVAELGTVLDRAGLSARALSGLARLDVHTVGELLDVPAFRLNQIRGLGEQYRKEIAGRVRAWRERLGRPTQEQREGQALGVERCVTALVDAVAEDRRPLVRSLLGLGVGELEGNRWPMPNQVYSGLGITRAEYTAAVEDAVETWSREHQLGDITQQTLEILAGAGRVMTVDQLATALVAVRGSTLDGEARLQHGVALVRAVFEGASRAEEPLVVVRRRSSGAPSLIALTEAYEAGDGEAAPPDGGLLLELAGDLGTEADHLVERGVVPPGEAVTRLRARQEAADFPGTDDHLVRLAGSASTTAAVSGFGELYPRSLALGTALDHALRGRPGRAITDEWLGRRVRARFPDLATVVPPRPQLDAVVAEALPGLSWNGQAYAPASRASSAAASRTGTVLGQVEPHAVHRQLARSLELRSALTLCTPPREYRYAAEVLATGYGVRVVDVAHESLGAARALAASSGIQWQAPLKADADRSSRGWGRLTRLMTDAVTPWWDELMTSTDPLLLTNVGPLMRYGLTTTLSELLDVATRKPAARWVLVARDSSRAVPLVEGRDLPLGPDRWVDLPQHLDQLGGDAALHRATAPDTGATA